MDDIRLLLGDSLEVLPTLKAGSADAVCTDPPAGINFMSKKFDTFRGRDHFVDFLSAVLRECLRVLKPGGYAFVWALPRTSHWTATAIEDAGFTLVERVAHIFGCLSDDTEILTEKGWEPYQKIEVGSLALAYNVGDDSFEWQPIQEVFTYDYCDTAYRIQSDRTDQLVSRNHRCLVERGRGYAFHYAETLQQQEGVPVLEDLSGLLKALPVPQSHASIEEQNLFLGMRESETQQRPKGQASRTDCEVCTPTVSRVQEGCRGSGEADSEQPEDVLLLLLSGQSPSAQASAALCQQQGQETARSRTGRKQEPGVEGRRHLHEDARPVRLREVRPLPIGTPGNGSQGWLCDGASPASGTGSRSMPDANGSGSPREPEPYRQPVRELDAVCLQPRSQTVRASRFTTTDLARITPVHYAGVVWCVRVPSGAFVARRNGKVFVTGNSGFPKSKGRLKPAVEDWWLARKPGPKVLPLPGLEECRVAANGESLGGGDTSNRTKQKPEGWDRPWMHDDEAKAAHAARVRANVEKAERLGRWPPNLCLTHSALCERIGTKKAPNGTGGPRRTGKQGGVAFGDFADDRPVHKGYADADGLETVDGWVCHPECPVFLLGEQSGERDSGGPSRKPPGHYTSKRTRGKDLYFGANSHMKAHNDTGTAARFFPQFSWSAVDDVPYLYQPKAGRSERWFYCRDCEDAFPPEARQEHLHGHYRDDKEDWSHLVGHPTQKPLALMSWLVKLVAGPGELVLDPFMGSGTTALACLREGRRFIGIEKDEEYHAISLARLQAEQAATPLFPT